MSSFTVSTVRVQGRIDDSASLVPITVGHPFTLNADSLESARAWLVENLAPTAFIAPTGEVVEINCFLKDWVDEEHLILTPA